MERKKMLIAIPNMGTMPVQSVRSLLAVRRPLETYCEFIGHSLVYQARDNFVQMAIEQGMDYLLFVDSDIVYPDNVIEKMLARDKDIVTGLYYKRAGNHAPTLCEGIELRENACATGEPITDVDRDFFKVQACGMGMCLIKVDVLKTILSKYHSCFTPFDGLGEDYSFCLRAAEFGYEVWCDNTFPLGHIGDYVFTKKDWIK